jgi:hypothetical protein
MSLIKRYNINDKHKLWKENIYMDEISIVIRSHYNKIYRWSSVIVHTTKGEMEMIHYRLASNHWETHVDAYTDYSLILWSITCSFTNHPKELEWIGEDNDSATPKLRTTSATIHWQHMNGRCCDGRLTLWRIIPWVTARIPAGSEGPRLGWLARLRERKRWHRQVLVEARRWEGRCLWNQREELSRPRNKGRKKRRLG